MLDALVLLVFSRMHSSLLAAGAVLPATAAAAAAGASWPRSLLIGVTFDSAIFGPSFGPGLRSVQLRVLSMMLLTRFAAASLLRMVAVLLPAAIVVLMLPRLLLLFIAAVGLLGRLLH